ncbi:MAG: 1-(5-phosphoribosyl)-5-[Clostridia bacterium]|nr:1-(5-phosphoribosyl)-5-[(5-phosphoribosylamino)methylideneamino]imidazole-4-carboxamide isomerase [Clostridia bacterium]
MIIFPAIDLYEKKAVRLFKGNYAEMTVYSDRPWEIACDFAAKGASAIHIVDLEGAKDGTTPNIDVIKKIIDSADLFVEVGGGIRSMETVKKYIEAGVDRVILGTAAVNDEEFLKEAVAAYGDHIAVGVDVKDGYVAIKGWVEKSQYTCFDFCEKMKNIGVSTLICTDISKDGAMQGTNHELYRELSSRFDVNITASGGVSSLDDVKKLADLGIYGAIIGKAYYTGAIDLEEAVRIGEGKE